MRTMIAALVFVLAAGTVQSHDCGSTCSANGYMRDTGLRWVKVGADCKITCPQGQAAVCANGTLSSNDAKCVCR